MDMIIFIAYGIMSIIILSAIITIIIKKIEKKNTSDKILFGGKFHNTDISLREAINELSITNSFVDLLGKEKYK